MAKLIKMVRDVPEYNGGPVTADASEEAVGAFLASGWKKADVKEEPKAEEKPKAEERSKAKEETKAKNPKQGK